MIRRTVRLAGLLFLLRGTAYAQDRVAIGLRTGYDHRASALSGGAELNVRLAPRFALRPSIDLFAMEGGYSTYRAYNIDVQYAVTPMLYLGGGVGSRWFRASDVAGDLLGLNLLAGGQVASDPLELFVEGRLFSGRGTTGWVIAGVRLRL